MKLNYAIIAVIPDKEDSIAEIAHACFYEEKPDQNDFDILKEELETDPQFDLVGRSDYILMEAPESIMEVYWKDLGKEID